MSNEQRGTTPYPRQRGTQAMSDELRGEKVHGSWLMAIIVDGEKQ